MARIAELMQLTRQCPRVSMAIKVLKAGGSLFIQTAGNANLKIITDHFD